MRKDRELVQYRSVGHNLAWGKRAEVRVQVRVQGLGCRSQGVR